MPTTGFEFVEHTADWAVHVYGADLTELLINAAHAMSSLLVAHPDAIPADRNLEFELEAVDREGLLVEWLTELAYWAESEMLLFREFTLSEVSATHLKASLTGGRAAELQKHIKAVTYHNLNVMSTGRGLEATIVFDV